MTNHPFSSNNNNKRVREEDDSVEKRKLMSVHDRYPPARQFELIKEQSAKYEGDEKYMLSKAWYISWEAFCLGLKNTFPAKIDNSSLLLEDGSLKPNMIVDEDFYLVPLRAWRILIHWYGIVNPASSILYVEPSKKAKNSKSTESHKKRKWIPIIEDKLHFKVLELNKTIQRGTRFTLSPNSTIAEFQTSLLKALDLSSGTAEIELWLLNSDYIISSSSLYLTRKVLDNPKLAEYIDSTQIDIHSTISNYLSSHPMVSSFTKNDHYYHLAVEYINSNKKSNTNSSVVRGLCGLQNLGNTCYMNSALQCLSNTPILTEWFLQGNYRKDINTTNPLGLNGKLAESFADMIMHIWNNNNNMHSISPKEFKSTFEKFNPHFIGYQQQDSQELLSFLLDGLHEDLNRVKDKPYIELPDFDDVLADKEVATCFWNYHRARNNSIIVDLFQGQFKSKLTCDECKKVSVTFDPFMYLSLPLPTTTTTTESNLDIEVVYVPYLPSQRQLKMTIQLNKDAKISHLKQEIENNIISSSLTISNDHSLLVVEMFHGKIFKIFEDKDGANMIRSTDTIYVYQLPCPPITDTKNDDWVVFPVYCATDIDVKQSILPSTQFGFPIVLAIEKEKLTNLKDLYGIIVHHIERYCIVKLFEEDDSFSGNKKIEETNDKIEDMVKAYFQQPIHTTAAVTPAGGRPMVPMPNLFNIKIFDSDIKYFPTGSTVYWNNKATMIEQGQGILLEWSVSKAQQAFGGDSSLQNSTTFDHDHHSEINTEAWREYEEIASHQPFKRSRMTTRSSNTLYTLEDCLNEFTSDERLSNDDLWYCPRCKKHQRASKKMDIWKLPEILVVHLKRFSQVRRWGNKIDTFIDFPIERLDMTDRVLSLDSEGLIYDLYAIDNHYGDMGGGHYTAYAQNLQNKAWYNFDDSHVNKVTTKDIKTNAAYLLFYKRRR